MIDKKKILVAEDDKFLASAYRVKLKKKGYDVKVAANGEEVFDYLNVWIPDLIILDLVMPVLDGFIVLEKLKASSSFTKIPVMVTTNLAQKEDKDRVVALGADDYIVKSDMSLNDLLKKIDGILSK